LSLFFHGHAAEQIGDALVSGQAGILIRRIGGNGRLSLGGNARKSGAGEQNSDAERRGKAHE
jgi:hypothetical protein